MDQLEITFTRSVSYTIALNEAQIKDLHGKIKKVEGIKLSREDFIELIENDELLGEHEEGVDAWLLDHQDDWEVSNEDDIEDIEIHV